MRFFVRRNMGSELEENRQWLSAVLESIDDAVITTDSNGYVRFMNSAAESSQKRCAREQHADR